MGVNNTMTQAEGDEVCWMVLKLCRAVRDEMRRDDRAPIDFAASPSGPLVGAQSEKFEALTTAPMASGRRDGRAPERNLFQEVPMDENDTSAPEAVGDAGQAVASP